MGDQNPHNAQGLEQEFERRLANASGVNPVFSHAAKEQMRAMIEQIARTDVHLAKIRSAEQNIAVKSGFIAEEWHAETYNLDAILKNDSSMACTDKYKAEFSGAGFKANDTPDLIVLRAGNVEHQSQSKYYKDSQATYDKMRLTDKDGNIKYREMDSLIGPSDQIEEIKTIAKRARIKEETKGTRPAVTEAAGMVEDNVSATLKNGDVKSAPLSSEDAKEIARSPSASAKKNIEDQYKSNSTTLKMKEAAAGAAAMSAIISGTVNVVTYAKLVQEGKLAPADAVIKIASETAASAADSAIKAAATTGAQSLVVRYGSQELVRKMAGQSVGALVRSNAVSVAVVSTIDAIKDLVLFASGRITAEQLEERTGKNILTTSAAALGGTVGATAAGGLAAGAFSAAALPMLGGLVGGLICSMAMELAIENGIEAPYRDLVSNTEQLRDAARILDEVSQEMFKGQVHFERFLLADADLDESFGEETRVGDHAANKMRMAIDKI